MIIPVPMYGVLRKALQSISSYVREAKMMPTHVTYKEIMKAGYSGELGCFDLLSVGLATTWICCL